MKTTTSNTRAGRPAIEDYVNEQVQIAVGQILRVKDDRYTIDIEGLMGLHEAIRDECILEIIGAAAGKKKDIGDLKKRVC